MALFPMLGNGRTDGCHQRGVRPLVPVLLAFALFSLGGVASLAAQQAVGGTVVDAGTNRPIAGAQIVIQGTELGTLSDNRGRFLILNVPGQQVSLEVIMIGYRAWIEAILVGQADLRVELIETAIALDEIVVTGVAGEQQARAIGNSVGKLNTTDIQEVAPSVDIQKLVSANIPGVRIMNSGGEVGMGGTMRIRGSSSLTLGPNPLVYVDGVRVNGVDNSAALGGIGFDGDQQPSRINDFNPDEIESIEVIKGPAAATLYGTEASNGVIQIITKRGNRGAPRVSMTIKQGANWLHDPVGAFPPVYYPCTGTSTNAPVPEGANARAFDKYRCTPGEITEFNSVLYDQEVFGFDWFRTGHSQSYGGEVSGGSESVTYFLSGEWDRDEGYVPNNWKKSLSGRANFSYTPNEKVKLDFSMGGVRTSAESPSAQQPLPTAIVWACPAPGCEAGSGFPNAIDGPYRGYIAYLPEVYEDEIEGYQDVDRLTFSVSGTHNPVEWLNQRLTVGGDFANIRNSELYKATGSLGSFVNWGRKWLVDLKSSYITVDYGANASYNPLESVKLTTSAGVQYYERREESNESVGEFFPLEALETVSSGSTRRGEEDFLENKTFGLYVQEQVSWNDRVYLTGAVRGDDNSAFGQNFDFVVYPKFSASWVVSEEDFLGGLSWLNTLKLRTAWGRSGQQPDVFDAIRTYEPTVGPSGAAVVTPENIGNPDLQPEVGEELEVGFDASLLDDRIGLEFTVFRQKTKDALVRVPALPSRGFPGFQMQNLGEIKNNGFELGINAAAWRSENVALDLTATVSSTKNEVVDLGGQPPVLQSSSNGQYHVEGFPLGGIFKKRVVSADLVDQGGRTVATNAMCEGGSVVAGTNFSRGGGAAVPCGEAPAVYFGQPIPEWEGSFSANLTLFRNLQLYGLVDWIGGITMINGDVAASHRFFINTRAILERTDPVLLGYEALGEIWQPGIMDFSFAKLRTVAATYTLPSSWAAWFNASRISVTASADNVMTIWQAEDGAFGHKSMDIERSTQVGGATAGMDAYVQEGWPMLKRFLTTFRITF